MRNARNRIRRGALAALLALALAGLLGAVGAEAAGSFSAHAGRPAYDESTLELGGTGGYRTAKLHAQLKVTVCLNHRIGARFFQVRCATGSGAGRLVQASVSVPGCVKGTWRTSAAGEALNRQGAWIHQASAVSRPFRC